MKIPRLRILRHLNKNGLRRHWLFILGPTGHRTVFYKWNIENPGEKEKGFRLSTPCIEFYKSTSNDELEDFFGRLNNWSLDIVLEYSDENGGCIHPSLLCWSFNKKNPTRTALPGSPYAERRH